MTNEVFTLPTAQQNLELAAQHFNAGRFNEARTLGLQVIAQEPANSLALNLLGVIARHTGQLEQAADFFRRAIAVNPTEPSLHQNLAMLYSDVGRQEEALASARQAVAISPASAEPLQVLGLILRRMSRIDEALAALQRAVSLKPDWVEAQFDLATACQERLLFDDAASAYQRVLTLQPDHPEALNNFGNTLQSLGRPIDAMEAYRKALALRPDFADAHCNLGLVLVHAGKSPEAAGCFRRSIACRPTFAQPYYSLAMDYLENGDFQAAMDLFRRAIQLRPQFAEALGNLGTALMRIGDVRQAVECFRKSNEIRPDPSIAGNVPFAVQFLPDFDDAKIAGEHERWNRQFVAPLGKSALASSNDRSPGRRLRVGYVSPDFRGHPVGRFMLPLLEQHDVAAFEVYCYSDATAPDAVTERCRALASVWRETARLSDAQLAQVIHEDRIDILVDLAMHSAGNRLLVFARKPAPVQVSYLAYVGSSGLKAMDYRLSDPFLDPPGSEKRWYTEKTVNLPSTYWCYAAPAAAPQPDAAPALANGYVTFGSFNNYSKVSDPALHAWASLLDRVPGSKLRVHSPPGAHRARARDVLRGYGVDARRLQFVPTIATGAYFEQYQTIDIALDPFPYAGGATTCDALWMGVPVVSLAGATGVSRGGLSILSNIGLSELAADSTEAYVKIAARLAADVPYLVELRSTLRDCMLRSPLMDATRFARDVEEAFVHMWTNWRDGAAPPQ